MTDKPKKLTLWVWLKFYWQEVPPIRWCFIALIAVFIFVTALNVFNAAFVYEDWRCLTGECKILKDGDKEMLLLED